MFCSKGVKGCSGYGLTKSSFILELYWRAAVSSLKPVHNCCRSCKLQASLHQLSGVKSAFPPRVYSRVSLRPFQDSWQSWDDVQCAFTKTDHILYKCSVFFSCQ